MATINVASNETTLLETLATHNFELHGAEIGNAAINKNFMLQFMEQKKSKKVVEGGLDFAEPVLIAENSNFDFRSHYSDIQADHQDPTREFKFDPKTLSGTVVLNALHDAQNQGRLAIKKWMRTLRMQADTTIRNKINTQLWAATPTSVQPESVRSIISDTPTTGTIGTISRVGNSYAQNKAYTTAISDIGSEAGFSTIHSQLVQTGGDIGSTPNLLITTPTLWGGLLGFMDANRRPKADDKMLKAGFDNFMIGTAVVGYDASCPASHAYGINTNHLFMKILRKGNFTFEPFSRKGNNLNSTSIFYLFYNLCTNLPSAHIVFTNVSTS